MAKQIKRSRWLGKFGEYVQAQFGNFETKLEKQDQGHYQLTIFNPNVKDRNIDICFDGLEASFYFSYQHAHFEYEDDEIEQLIDYTHKFLRDEYAAFQFFKDGKFAISGSQRSKDIDLSSVDSILKTFIPDLSVSEVEQRAMTLCEVMPEFSFDEHKSRIAATSEHVREHHYEYLKMHQYKLGVEYWSGKKDTYIHICWDGLEFEIIDITLEGLLMHEE